MDRFRKCLSDTCCPPRCLLQPLNKHGSCSSFCHARTACSHSRNYYSEYGFGNSHTDTKTIPAQSRKHQSVSLVITSALRKWFRCLSRVSFSYPMDLAHTSCTITTPFLPREVFAFGAALYFFLHGQNRCGLCFRHDDFKIEQAQSLIFLPAIFVPGFFAIFVFVICHQWSTIQVCVTCSWPF